MSSVVGATRGWRVTWEGARTDLHNALRALWRSPIYTVTAILTLGIGIGATTAAYSVVGSVLLKPLPFADPDRIVAVFSAIPTYDHIPPSYPDFADYREQSPEFDGMAFIDGDGAVLKRPDGAQHVLAAMVTSDFFSVLRARPVIGRTFEAADNRPSAPPVAVLSHALWINSFGADRAVVGRTIDLDIGSFTVVGVLAPGEAYPEWIPGARTDLYLPLSVVAYKQSDLHQRGNHADTRTIARLKPGIELAQATRRLSLVASRLASMYPATDSGFTANLVPLQREEVGDVRPAFAVLCGAVVLVFLLACADVANLSLVRATGRARELGVRTALGAGYSRIVRYVLTESALLAAGASVLGVVLAIVGVRAFLAVSPGNIPRIEEIAVDGRALLTAVVSGCAASALCALAPLMTMRRADLVPVLKSGGRGTRGDRRGLRLRTLIVTGQLAMTVVLVIGAGLLGRSFVKLRGVPLGYDPNHLIDWAVEAPRDADAQARWTFFQRAKTAIEVPGVTSVALINHVPSSNGVGTKVGVDGNSPANDSVGVVYATISPQFFRTMGIPLIAGRDFTDADMTLDAGVAIVSQSMAARYWPGQSLPLGHRMTVLNGAPHDADYRKPMLMTVVGVTGDIMEVANGHNRALPTVYMPFTRPVWGSANVIMHTVGPPGALMATIRRRAATVDPFATTDRLTTFANGIADNSARQRFTASVLTGFSGVALLLATLGIYGVISYAVTQRVAEIGIRMALGAQAKDVVRLMVRGASIFVVIGLGVGIGGAALLARAMQGLLFGVVPEDPLTFVSVSLFLGAIALLASYVPARRAARIDPLVALRAD